MMEYIPEQQYYANVALILFANEAKEKEIELMLWTLVVIIESGTISIQAETTNGLTMKREYDIYAVDRKIVNQRRTS